MLDLQSSTLFFFGWQFSQLIFSHIFSTTRFLFSLLLFVPYFNFWNNNCYLAVQAIPLFEAAFTRCTVMLILSYLWLGRSNQPLFGTTHIRSILIWRALVGCLSLSSSVYWWVDFWNFSLNMYSFHHIIYHFGFYCLISWKFFKLS